MTDRYTALTVILEAPKRDDDCESLITAIKQMRGVLDVKPRIATHEIYAATERARHDLGQRLWRVLWPSEGERDE